MCVFFFAKKKVDCYYYEVSDTHIINQLCDSSFQLYQYLQSPAYQQYLNLAKYFSIIKLNNY